MIRYFLLPLFLFLSGCVTQTSDCLRTTIKVIGMGKVNNDFIVGYGHYRMDKYRKMVYEVVNE